MAPRVEAPEVNNGKVNCFSVDINDPSSFDPQLFDQLAKQVGYTDGIDTSMLKFVVIGGRMWIFPFEQSHFDFYSRLKVEKVGKLQSAGMVRVKYFIPDRYDETLVRRNIDDSSDSLESDLLKPDSERYKLGVMKEKLGKFFRVE